MKVWFLPLTSPPHPLPPPPTNNNIQQTNKHKYKQMISSEKKKKWEVHKLGGTSLGDASCYMRVPQVVGLLDQENNGML